MNRIKQGMPKGITSLYFIQMFSTFSFAILYSSLSLYITKQLGLSSTYSNSIVGLFLAFNFVLHLFGGIIGGNWLSNRFLFLFTTILQTIGLIFLVIPEISLYLGLSLFLIGCGLNTTSYNSILTQRFAPSDTRRDKAFFYSYSAMNIGFWAGFVFSGFYDSSNNYDQLFYVSIVTNLITIFLIVNSWSVINDVETKFIALNNKQKKQKGLGGILFILLLTPLLVACLNFKGFSNSLVIVISLVMLLVMIFLTFKQPNKIDQQKLMAFIILAITSIVFWMIYYTGPMGITLFIKNNVDKQFYNYQIATQWILNLNTIVIIIGSPLLATLLNKLQNTRYKISVSTQFIWAYLFLGLSFLSLSCGINFDDSNGYTALIWVIMHVVAQAVAELFIGPVGYSMIGRIAPPHLQGLLMGTWMMVSGVSAVIAHYFSDLMVKSESTNPLLSNPDYLHTFNELGVWAFSGAIVLYALSNKLMQFMNEKPDNEVKTISNLLANE